MKKCFYLYLYVTLGCLVIGGFIEHRFSVLGLIWALVILAVKLYQYWQFYKSGQNIEYSKVRKPTIDQLVITSALAVLTVIVLEVIVL